MIVKGHVPPPPCHWSLHLMPLDPRPLARRLAHLGPQFWTPARAEQRWSAPFLQLQLMCICVSKQMYRKVRPEKREGRERNGERKRGGKGGSEGAIEKALATVQRE